MSDSSLDCSIVNTLNFEVLMDVFSRNINLVGIRSVLDPSKLFETLPPPSRSVILTCVINGKLLHRDSSQDCSREILFNSGVLMDGFLKREL